MKLSFGEYRMCENFLFFFRGSRRKTSTDLAGKFLIILFLLRTKEKLSSLDTIFSFPIRKVLKLVSKMSFPSVHTVRRRGEGSLCGWIRERITIKLHNNIIWAAIKRFNFSLCGNCLMENFFFHFYISFIKWRKVYPFRIFIAFSFDCFIIMDFCAAQRRDGNVCLDCRQGWVGWWDNGLNFRVKDKGMSRMSLLGHDANYAISTATILLNKLNTLTPKPQ